MDRPTFLAACRRQAFEIALGQKDAAERQVALTDARDEAVFRAGEFEIDGSVLAWADGLREAGMSRRLFAQITETFGSGPGGEFLGEFTAHQWIRLGAELRRLEEAVCSDPATAPIS